MLVQAKMNYWQKSCIESQLGTFSSLSGYYMPRGFQVDMFSGYSGVLGSGLKVYICLCMPSLGPWLISR